MLTYINSDDCLAKGSIEKMVSLNENFSKPFVFFGDLEYIDSDSKPLKIYQPGEFNIGQMLFQNQINQPGVYWTRKITNRVGFFNIQYHYCFDYDLWMRFFNHGEFVYVPGVLARFRLHPDQKGKTIPLTCIRDQMTLLKQFFKREDLPLIIQNSREKVFLNHIFQGFLNANAQGSPNLFLFFCRQFLKEVHTSEGFLFFFKLFFKQISIFLERKKNLLKNSDGPLFSFKQD